MVYNIQTTFSRGEIDPALRSRIDLQLYQLAVSEMTNAFVVKEGGFKNRPGTRFVASAKFSNRKSMLVPFRYSASDTYILEFGHLYMRVYRYGSQVLDPNDDSIVEVATVYTEDDLERINIAQKFNLMFIVHPLHPVYQLSRSDHHLWTYELTSFVPDTASPENLSVAATRNYGTTGGQSEDQTQTYVVTAISPDTGRESLPSTEESVTAKASPGIWEKITQGPTDIVERVNYNTLAWDAVAGVDSYAVYREQNGLFGYLGTAGTNSFVDNGTVEPNFARNPPTERTPFNAAGKYPSAVTFFQQRSVWGGSVNAPDTLEFSAVGSFTDLSASPSQNPDEAITVTIDNSESTEIRHMLSMESLLILTSVMTHKITPGSEGLTPEVAANIPPVVKKATGYARPVRVNDVILFSERSENVIPPTAPEYLKKEKPNTIVSEYRYNGQYQQFEWSERSAISAHLVKDYNLTYMAYSQKPDSLVFATRDDGNMICITHMAEHEVYAFSRYTTNGKYESVACVEEGEETATYVTTRRVINGVEGRFVERFASRRTADQKDAFFLDCGLTFDEPFAATSKGDSTFEVVGHSFSVGDIVRVSDIESAGVLNEQKWEIISISGDDITLKNRFDDGAPEFTFGDTATIRLVVNSVAGADHLAGAEVRLYIDGFAAGPVTWQAGSNALPHEGSVIHVGLPYQMKVKTLALAGEAQIFASEKAVRKAYISYNDTRGLKVGPDESVLETVKARMDEQYDQPPKLLTGLYEYPIASWRDRFGQVVMVQDDPLPCSVYSLILNGTFSVNRGP